MGFLSMQAQTIPTPKWHWGKTLGWGSHPGDDGAAHRMEYVDADGNIYIASEAIEDIDPMNTRRGVYFETDTIALTLQEAALYVAKFDSTGNLLWRTSGISPRKTVNNSNQIIALGLVADAAGKLYVSYQFTDSIRFGSNWITETAADAKFAINIMQVNASDGTIGWNNTVFQNFNGGASASEYTTAAMDMNNQNELVLAVHHSDSLIFNYISNTGNTLRSKAHLVTSAFMQIMSFNAKGSATVLAANFMNSFTLDGTSLTTANGKGFVASFDGNGNLSWAKQIKSAGGAGGQVGQAWGLQQTASGSVYVTGEFFGTMKITGSNDSLVAVNKKTGGSNDGGELFYAKFSNIGNVVWMKQAKGESKHRGKKIIQAKSNTLLMLVRIGSDALYLDGDSLPAPNSSGTERWGLIEVDTNGTAKWMQRVNENGAISKEFVFIHLDAAKNLYFSGAYEFLQPNFGSSVTLRSLPIQEEHKFYYMIKSGSFKTSNPPIGLFKNNTQLFSLYPNPATCELHINLTRATQHATITIVDIQGKVVYAKQVQSLQSQLDISTLHQGIYFVRIDADGETAVKKLVKH